MEVSRKQMLDMEKRLNKLNKKNKPLKKFKGDGESETKLEPYKREKIDIRDVDDLLDEDDDLSADE